MQLLNYCSSKWWIANSCPSLKLDFLWWWTERYYYNFIADLAEFWCYYTTLWHKILEKKGF
jgi:hypothetical protein